jgi:5-(aminomethyl)-3-furanmethanol phosphate kinase
MSSSQPPRIVKLGGSLYDLPDLPQRLKRWLGQAPEPRAVLVPGGGIAANVIRDYDRVHRLGEEASHWLALQMLAVNAHFLATLLPDAVVVPSPFTPAPLAILDMHAFALADDARPGHLPHAWDVTSDSLAVRVAQVAEARELVLLKSLDWQGDDWRAAAAAGVVDGFFAEAARRADGLRIRVVNLRLVFGSARR